MKKLFCILTVIVLNIVFCTAVFAEKTTVYLQGEAVSLGEKAQISLSVKENLSVVYLHLKVSFPLETFSYDKTQTNACFGENVPEYVNYTSDLKNGYIELKFGSQEGEYAFSSDGELAVIFLNVKENAAIGKHTITCSGFNNDKSDALYSANRFLNVEYENIQIEIKEKTASQAPSKEEEKTSQEQEQEQEQENVQSQTSQQTTVCNHKWVYGGIVVKADCENDGENFYVCEYDSTHTKKEVFKALGHKLEEKTVKKNGEYIKVLKCTRSGCDYIEKDYTPSQENTLSSDIFTYFGADKTDAIIIAIGFFITAIFSFVGVIIKRKLDK